MEYKVVISLVSVEKSSSEDSQSETKETVLYERSLSSFTLETLKTAPSLIEMGMLNLANASFTKINQLLLKS